MRCEETLEDTTGPPAMPPPASVERRPVAPSAVVSAQQLVIPLP